MSKSTKFIIFFFLIIYSEVYAIELQKNSRNQFIANYRSKRINRSRTLALVHEPENPLIKSIKDKFTSLGAKLETSKWFNFIMGAILKVIALLEGNPILDIIKCLVTGVEVYYNAIKFPDKKLEELKKMSQSEDEAKAKEATTQSDDLDKEKGDSDIVKELKEGEKDARNLDCAGSAEVMKDEEGIDFIANVGTEDDEEVPAKFVQTQWNPKKFFKKLGKKFKSLQEKFAKVVEAFKEKLLKLENKFKEWLNKPIVKALITVFECAVVPILTMALKGFSNLAAVATGFSLINIFKQGPKFLKMVIDGIKLLRSGFLRKTIKEKYMDYGKGTATLLMVLIQTAVGSFY